jgi:amino acid permease
MSKSTLTTAVSVSTSMIGSAMILFPITFNQTGIVLNVLITVCFHLTQIILSAILALTCKLLVSHVRLEEADVSESITRKLGPAFGTCFAVFSAVEGFLVASIYFLLASDLCYCALLSIIGTFNCYIG